MTVRILGRLSVEPPAARTVLCIPWGKAAEAPEERGLTALACAALFGLDGFRIGHHSSAVAIPPASRSAGFDERLQTIDPVSLRRLLIVRRAHRLGDRVWQARRALHLAAWGESCVDALPDEASATAITDREIVELASEVARFVRDGERQETYPDQLHWRGGLYCGTRNQHRLTVGVQLPWFGEPSVAIAASHLGRVGAPGVLAQTLAEREVPYYAAAAMPVVEHGTTCLSIGLSTTTDHVVALLEVVRDVLRGIDNAGVPTAQLARLRAGATLYEAVHPSDDLFEQLAESPSPGKRVPAVAVVGRLTERTVARLREAVHAW